MYIYTHTHTHTHTTSQVENWINQLPNLTIGSSPLPHAPALFTLMQYLMA